MLKNYFSLTAIFAIFAMAFVSCNTTDNENDLTEPIAVNLRANITPATTRVINDQWQANDQVGLFMVRAGQTLSATSVLTNANNALMTVENGVLTSNPPVMYPLTGGNVGFIAYYPFHSSVGSNFTIPINVANQSAGLPTEVLFSNNITNQVPTANAVTLNFRYSLAKLELRITGGANSAFTETDFANMTASIEGMYTQADLQLATGTFTSHSGKQTIALYSVSNNATSATFRALVLPTNEEITFLFNVSGTTHRHTLTADYVAANLYRLNFAIDFPAPTATLLNALIIPRDENVQNIVVDGMYISDSLDGIVINGVRWATRNVAAPGTFAENPWDTGMFYQFNRRIGWSSTDPMINSNGGTTWDSSPATGTIWQRENDPCPPGWRIPNHREMAGSIVWNENYSPTVRADYFRATLNGVAGVVVGIAPSQIFLPTVGRRNMNDGAHWVAPTPTSMYWQANQDFPGNHGVAGMGAGMGVSSTNLSEGNLIRCVADEIIPVRDIVFSGHVGTYITTVFVGESVRLPHIRVLPWAATDLRTVQTSSNPTILSNGGGAMSPGTATLTIATYCGTHSVTAEVTVEQPFTISSSLEGVEIDGIRWATRNVDMPGTFAQSPESPGMFYQWNRRTAWAVTGDVTDWNTTAATGTMWYAENDPCPDGWRVPTRDELVSLRASSSVRMIHNGVEGNAFGAGENRIFLPSAGLRQSAVGGHIPINNGLFWSSTPGAISGAYQMDISPTQVGAVHSNNAARGISVRCVAE